MSSYPVKNPAFMPIRPKQSSVAFARAICALRPRITSARCSSYPAFCRNALG
jgi:hypothetical protein